MKRTQPGVWTGEGLQNTLLNPPVYTLTGHAGVHHVKAERHYQVISTAVHVRVQLEPQPHTQESWQVLLLICVPPVLQKNKTRWT